MTEQVTISYQDFFHANQRARVDLPLGNSRFFHEWAVIDSAQADRLILRLSRDVLPQTLQFAEGEPVAVRAGSDGQGYRCHGVIEDRESGNLALRLSGSIIPDELRSYFRLDTSLQFDYAPATSGETWEYPDNRGIIGTGTEFGDSSLLQRAPLGFGLLEPPNGCSPGAEQLIVNISGGGLRAQTTEEIPAGSVLKLAFHLPHSKPYRVEALAEVVYCQPIPSIWRSGTRYTIGMKYLKINERCRDSIIKFVCSEEIKKIRSCNKRFHSLISS